MPPTSENDNSIDWKLQDPNGAARMTTYGGERAELSFVDPAPGGHVSGVVCFDGDPDAQPGQYVMLNDGFISFSSNRLAWVNNFRPAREGPDHLRRPVLFTAMRPPSPRSDQAPLTL